MTAKTILLGVKDKVYEGIWVRSGTRYKGRVTFTFSEELPEPYNSDVVKLEYTNWRKLTPYELGGQMVNRILECEKTS